MISRFLQLVNIKKSNEMVVGDFVNQFRFNERIANDILSDSFSLRKQLMPAQNKLIFHFKISENFF